jgi:hypothetical protein
MKVREKISMPNLILISGNGRNSGKTLFATNLISHLSSMQEVTAIKISPHFHTVHSNTVLLQGENYTICEEQEITQKDSSLMLQAGARRVFFVMAKQEHLQEAFNSLAFFLTDSVVICESGGLHKIVNAGMHFFIKEMGAPIVKPISFESNPITVNRTENHFDFSVHNIKFNNNKLQLINGTVCWNNKNIGNTQPHICDRGN